MRVAILGTGGIGLGTAAFLRQTGHTVRVWSPSGRGTAAFAGGAPLRAQGAVDGTFPIEAVRDIGHALDDADAVLIAVPGNGHRAVMDAAAPHVREGQVAIISSHASFSGLYLSKLLAARGISVPIVAWASTAVMAQRTGGAAVQVSTVRGRFDVAALPAGQAAKGFTLCAKLIGDRFRRRDDLLAVALGNVNPHAHMAMALGNLTRIEAGERWANYTGITAAVGRLIEALDAERVNLARSFGIDVRTMQQHMQLSFGVPMGTVGEMSAAVHALGVRPLGPATLETRYVLEDAPFGLVPMIAIGRIAGIALPLHEAGLKLLSVIWERDFAAENNLLPELDLDGLNAADLRRRVREGWLIG